MTFQFQKAKNGENTVIVNDIYLHSSYNPSREAERFVQSISINYSTPLILITEPGLGYIIPLIKDKFPNSKIGVISYVPEFKKYAQNVDINLTYYNHTNNFEDYLLQNLDEITITTTYFVQWQPSSKIFIDIEKKVLNGIKNCLDKAKTILVTREFFEKKWFINSCNFIKYIQNPMEFNYKINKPVIIISSGPSLQSAISTISKIKKYFFIVVLSSAIKVCIHSNIIPDLCISTDGGFWAGEHLKILYKYNIPLVLPLESFIQKKLLKKLKIIPLTYNDGLSKEIATISKFPTMLGERNGTVSGTALKFILSNSTENIYFAGLDMTSQKGFQHSQPNELELNNSLHDYKLYNCETRAVKGEYSTGVLTIYKQWFDSLNFGNRKVFRIINNEYKKNTLGKITDISVEEFNNTFINCNKSNTTCYRKDITNNQKNIFHKTAWNHPLYDVWNYIKKISTTEEWMRNLYPLSFASLIHNKENADIKNRIEKQDKTLLNKIEKILNE